MISVAMATYNGEKYIKQQLVSILENLSENDEIIISDDGSTDETRKIVEKFHDGRIKWIEGPKKGVAANFGNAIAACSGSIIFLSDQDDVWHKNKVERVLETFKTCDCLLVRHDATIMNADGKTLSPSFYSVRGVYSGFIKNFIRSTYHGCCMAFKAELKEKVLPVPTFDIYHDWWIGLIAEKQKKSIFISDVLMDYRRHEGNASQINKHLPLFQMVSKRIKMARLLLARRR